MGGQKTRLLGGKKDETTRKMGRKEGEEEEDWLCVGSGMEVGLWRMREHTIKTKAMEAKQEMGMTLCFQNKGHRK